MIGGKNCHNLAVVKDKLFVIASDTDGCEVFDYESKTFVALKQPLIFYNFIKAVSIGSRIMIFEKLFWYTSDELRINCYDVDKDEWSQESYEAEKSLCNFVCAKVPWF